MAITPNTTFTSGAVLTADQMNRLPWGIMGTATTSAVDQTGITGVTDVTGASITFTAVANRYYIALGFAVVAASAGSPALQQFLVTNSAASTTYAIEIGHFTAGGGNVVTADCQSTPFTLSAGSNTLKLRFGRSGGDAATYTVSNSTRPASIAVFDIGQA